MKPGCGPILTARKSDGIDMGSRSRACCRHYALFHVFYPTDELARLSRSGNQSSRILSPSEPVRPSPSALSDLFPHSACRDPVVGGDELRVTHCWSSEGDQFPWTREKHAECHATRGSVPRRFGGPHSWSATSQGLVAHDGCTS